MTLAQITKFRDTAETAYLRALKAKSYNINPGGGAGRQLSRQDLAVLHEKFLFWQSEFEKKEAGKSGMQIKYGTSSN